MNRSKAFYVLMLLFVAKLQAAMSGPDGQPQQTVPSLFQLCAHMFNDVTKQQFTDDHPILCAILHDPYLIHIAAAYNDINILQVAGYYGISVNEPMQFMGVDHYPLHCAANHGHTQAMAKLLQQGANINQFSGLYTPLMMAAENGDTTGAELLLQNGANKRLRNSRDQSAYNLAANSTGCKCGCSTRRDNMLLTLEKYQQ